MIDIRYTHHAETRMQQRAIRERDIPLIIELGTQVDDETWIYAAIEMLPARSRASRGRYTGWNALLIAKS